MLAAMAPKQSSNPFANQHNYMMEDIWKRVGDLYIAEEVWGQRGAQCIAWHGALCCHREPANWVRSGRLLRGVFQWLLHQGLWFVTITIATGCLVCEHQLPAIQEQRAYQIAGGRGCSTELGN